MKLFNDQIKFSSGLGRSSLELPNTSSSSINYLQSPGSDTHNNSSKSAQLSRVADGSVVSSRGRGRSSRLRCAGASAGAAVRGRGRCRGSRGGERGRDGRSSGGGSATDGRENTVVISAQCSWKCVVVGLTSSERQRRQQGWEGRQWRTSY